MNKQQKQQLINDLTYLKYHSKNLNNTQYMLIADGYFILTQADPKQTKAILETHKNIK